MIFMSKLFIFQNLVAKKIQACLAQEAQFPKKLINNAFQVTFLLLS